MLRTGLIFGTFMIATLGLIWIMPTPDRGEPASVEQTRQVTRTEVGMMDAPKADDAPVALAAAQVAPVPVAEKLKSQDTTAQLLKAVKQRKIRTDKHANIDEMTQDVLAGLGMAQARENKPIAQEDTEMRQMTSSILSNLRKTSHVPEPSDKTSLQGLVIEALKQGAHDDYIDELVNEAAGAGEIAVPSGLVTADGRVDTQALLNSIVRKATQTKDHQQKAKPLVVGGDGVEVRVVQRAGKTEKFNFYTVSRGDSLGSIAVRFYGDVTMYTAIFEANRRTLASPNQIRVGQRLVIPSI